MKMFTEVLSTLRRGMAINHVNQELEKLLREIELTGKAGSISVTLSFKPDKADENAAEVTAKCKVTMPQRDLPKGMIYIKDGEAHRVDPRQIEMLPDESGRGAVVEGTFNKLDTAAQG